MAKKSSKNRKSARKSPARKPVRKVAARKPARASAGPKMLKPGRGPSPREIGEAVVKHFNASGPDTELWQRYWSRNTESVEGGDQPMMWTGLKAIKGKSEWWTSQNQVHSAQAEGPYVGASGFSIKFRIDVEERQTGKRTVMEEIGVYTVAKGKVVREEFMYGSSRVISEGRRVALVETSAKPEESLEPLAV
jgi:hypothetical protein